MPAASGRAVSRADGLVVAPFRAVRYDPARVSSLAAVTSPPYDLINDKDARLLAQAEPHNIIRLILPREDESGPEGPYEHARRTLCAWIDDGTLRRDPDPAVYVLEQAAPGRPPSRGIVGALELRAPQDGVVLPHEDVLPGPVEDRLALLRATEANLEPIFLGYEGAGVTSTLVADVAQRETPVLSTTTMDGITHRLWPITDPDRLTAMAEDLHSRQAVIADGHHRYAAYLRYQSERRGRNGPGPWDRALALLVEITTTAPQLTSISRVIPHLTFETAIQAAGPGASVTMVTASPDEVVRRLLQRGHDSYSGSDQRFPTDHGLEIDGSALALITGDGRVALMAIVDPAYRDASAAEFLHEELVGKRWQRDVSDADVQYVHDVESAVRLAAQADGVAIVLRPPTVAQVLNVARAGRTMPRKSTSFGPKPRDGLVVRTLTES